MRRNALLAFAMLYTPLIAMSQTNITPQKSPVEMMREMRSKWLKTVPAELKIQPTPEFPRVFAALMEMPLGTNTITVLASCNGDASLYTTSTFGVIGGIGHEAVRSAAKQFVRVCEKHYEDGVATKDYPYPSPGHVFFYLICFDGVRLIDRDEKRPAAGKDKGADLFSQGQRVLTELRMVAEQANAKKP
jgi:hypothetical protein